MGRFLGLEGIYHGAKSKMHTVKGAFQAASLMIQLEETATAAVELGEAGVLTEEEAAMLEVNCRTSQRRMLWSNRP